MFPKHPTIQNIKTRNETIESKVWFFYASDKAMAIPKIPLDDTKSQEILMIRTYFVNFLCS